MSDHIKGKLYFSLTNAFSFKRTILAKTSTSSLVGILISVNCSDSTHRCNLTTRTYPSGWWVVCLFFVLLLFGIRSQLLNPCREQTSKTTDMYIHNSVLEPILDISSKKQNNNKNKTPTKPKNKTTKKKKKTNKTNKHKTPTKSKKKQHKKLNKKQQQKTTTPTETTTKKQPLHKTHELIYCLCHSNASRD